MEYIVTKTIPIGELKEYKDYIGFLFKSQGVFNICDTEEDIAKSNQWFSNRPLNAIIVNDEPINIGDRFLAIVNNQELNGNTFKYNGPHSEGINLVNLTDKNGLEVISTNHIIKSGYKVIRTTNRKDKEKLINGKISEL
jgi:hypothetical protein